MTKQRYDAESAKAAYLSNYDKDWKGFKYITEVSIDVFKKWLYDGYRQRKPFAKYSRLTESTIINETEEADDIIQDFLEEISAYDLFYEFLYDKEHGVKQKKWNLIPLEQYRNFLIRTVRGNMVSNLPYDTVYKWFTQVIVKNTVELEQLTAIAGHESWAPIDDFNDVFEEKIGHEVSEWDEMSDYLDKIGFYDWALLPDGTEAITDYGLYPLYKLIREFRDNMSAEELLVLINRILDVTHCRGDLASLFIQGGSKALTAISAGKSISNLVAEKTNFGELLKECTGRKIYVTEAQLKKILNNKKGAQ